MQQGLTREPAMRALEHLRRGSWPDDPWLAPSLHVGQDEWMSAARDDLRNAAEVGANPVRFVIGGYGTGKSHFLQAVLGQAVEQGFWCCYCSLERERDLRNLELEVLWKALSRRLYTPDAPERVDLPGALDRVRHKEDPEKLEDRIRAARVEPGLERVVTAYLKAGAAGRDTEELRRWMLGEPTRPAGIARRIDASNAVRMLESLVSLVRSLGYKGVAVAVDEIELAISGTRPQRQRFYESVRQLIDRTVPGYVFYGAGTDDVLRHPQGFSEHQPLWSRIEVFTQQSARERPSPSQLLAYLREPTETDLFQIGQRIRRLHGVALDWDAEASFQDGILKRMAALVAARPVGGKPRWMVTSVLLELDRKRADPSFEPLKGLERRVEEAGVRALRDERS